MADEEVRISASMQDSELLAALSRIENRLESVERSIDDTGDSASRSGAQIAEAYDQAGDSAEDAGRSARAAGEKISGGLRKGTRSARELGQAADEAEDEIEDLGDEALKTSVKVRSASASMDSFSKAMRKAGRRSNGLGAMLRLLKIPALTTALFAAAGGASALGAGAAIAVGGLSPMVGVLAAILPLGAAYIATMGAMKLASEALTPTLEGIKSQFSGLGEVIAAGGLRAGLEYFSASLDGLVQVAGQGLAGIGAELGQAARAAGDLVSTRAFLDQVSRIFAGLRPLVADVAAGLINMARAALNVTEAALPMAQDMTAMFRDAAEAVQAWTAEQLANGNMTRWLNSSWDLFRRTIGVVVDIAKGLFNIFRIGAGYAGELGLSIEQLARDFKNWTASAAGQARINQYFRDSLPALREMGKLLGMAAGGMAGLAANQNVAPLLAQIRTEFAPALGELVTKLSGQQGLGPALISAATAIVEFINALDFSALTTFVVALAGLISGIVWIMQNVPGASMLVSGLVGAFLAFKLLTPVIGILGRVAGAFMWFRNAATLTGTLSTTQKFIGGVLIPTLRTLITFIGGKLVAAIRLVGVALRAAFISSPIGWVVLAIGALVAGFLWLWNNCAAFRAFWIGLWQALKTAAIAAWNWIKMAAVNTWNWIRGIWTGAVGFFVGVWNAIVGAVRVAVSWIVSIARGIWTFGIQPVLNVILAWWRMVWSMITFSVQTAVYVIVGIITLILIGARAVFMAIAAVVRWLFTNVVIPIFNGIRSFVTMVFNAIAFAAQWVWNKIMFGARWLYTAVILPVFNAIRTAATVVWNAISFAAQWCWNKIMFGVNWVRGVLIAAFNIIRAAGAALWRPISAAARACWNWIKGVWQGAVAWFQSIWRPIANAGTAVWDGIKSAAVGAANMVKSAWNSVVGTIRSVWNAIAGAWNSIPSYTVPDWIPGIGGSSFGLPSLPTMWHGGPTPGGPALVGEHGPEPLVRGGQVTDILGANGPEIRTLPTGGHVVPNPATLAANPGLTATIPPHVAAALSSTRDDQQNTHVTVTGGSGDNTELLGAVRELATAVHNQAPPVTVTGDGDTEKAVLSALRQHRREQNVRERYRYTAGRG